MNIRSAILEAIEENTPRDSHDADLQQVSVLNSTVSILRRNNVQYTEKDILTEWHELFRTGYLAWGINLNNENCPWFHLTARGTRAFEQRRRDPSNPEGYMNHLQANAILNPIALSYISEGLACFNNGFHKSSAVMIGAAAESMILELRDTIKQKMTSLSQTIPPNLIDWRIRAVITEIERLLDAKKSSFPKQLREEYEAYWGAYSQPIRSARNDAGHPASIDPVTEDAVHASLLIFPMLVKLCSDLMSWVNTNWR